MMARNAWMTMAVMTSCTGSLVKLSVKPTDQFIQADAKAEPDDGKAARCHQRPRLAYLVIVIVIVIEALVQHQEAKAADDHRDDNRDDIPADESQVDGVGQVSLVGLAKLVGLGRAADLVRVDDQVGGAAGQVSQRRPQCHPDQRHSGLERDEQHDDAYPLRTSQAHFTQDGK